MDDLKSTTCEPMMRRCCRDTVAYHITRGVQAFDGLEFGCHWCEDSVRLDNGQWRTVHYNFPGSQEVPKP